MAGCGSDGLSIKSRGSVPARTVACKRVREGERFVGKQALIYAVGISAQSVGALGTHMQTVRISPGGRAKAHKHEGHETAIYALSGESGVWHGTNLESHSIVQPGDFFCIPANVPHLPYNPSATETCVALIARTDPNEQESVVLLPELEGLISETGTSAVTGVEGGGVTEQMMG